MWIESMVRGAAARRALYELDLSIMGLRESVGDVPDVVRLTSVYHNLLRRWASP
jgi:PKHD-type hydroxylase